jgi:sirohydrochlorin cobaltochelatase
MTTAIILFAHGSRDPLWRVPIEAVATEIRRRHKAALVSCAYLELCLPSLPQAADDMVLAGATHIRVFPLFLGVGKHAREDLPLIIEEIRSKHPQLGLELLATAGESAQLTALLADIALA